MACHYATGGLDADVPKVKRTAPGEWEPPLVVQIYYIKGLVLCQIVVLTSGRSAGIKSCVRGSQESAICTRHSQAARISRAMCGTIAMGSMQAAPLPKFSMNATVGTRPRSAHIMPVWIAWILPNAMAVDGIRWLRQSVYGNGWNCIAVTHRIGGAVFACASDGENHCGTSLLGNYAVEQKRVKTVPKTGIIVQAKAQQNASSFGG